MSGAAAPSPLDALRTLWDVEAAHSLHGLLPFDGPSLERFYESLQAFVSARKRSLAGTVQPGAIVNGDLVAMGEGSVIEAGAVIHESARVVLGARCRVRSGAVLRDEVVAGDDCLIGVHCEVFRSVLLGPRTHIGHFVLLADSILGRDVMAAGNVVFSSSMIEAGREVPLKRGRERVLSGRRYLGALVGDGVRLGASTTLCPGCIVLPGLTLPPQTVLHGTIDAARRDRLMSRFFKEYADDASPEV